MSDSSTRAESTITGTDDQPRNVVDEFDAVAVRQAEVEDDEVGLARPGVDQSLLQRVGLDDVPAFGLQRRANEASDLSFVLDEQRGG